MFLFSGPTGQAYGYQDRWTDGDIFEYTGEGQRGDMRLASGNAAILNHAENGKDLHLFEIAGRGYVRYVGQMVCDGYKTVNAPDVDGRVRKAIVFNLVRIEATNQAGGPPSTQPRAKGLGRLWTMPTEELHRRATEAMRPAGGRRRAMTSVYQRSEAVRVFVLRRANGVCEACGAAAPFTALDGRPYLEPHHIRRLSDGGPDNPVWVAGVCPNCHRHAHYGADKDALNERLANDIRRLEEQGKPIA